MEILEVPGKNEDRMHCEQCGSEKLVKLFSSPFVNIKKSPGNISTDCGKDTTCCGSVTPCERRPCDR